MTNAQFYTAVALPTIIPTLAVILSVLRMDKRADSTDARIDKLETRLESRLGIIEADLRRFFELFGRHDEAIDTLKKRSS